MAIVAPRIIKIYEGPSLVAFFDPAIKVIQTKGKENYANFVRRTVLKVLTDELKQKNIPEEVVNRAKRELGVQSPIILGNIQKQQIEMIYRLSMHEINAYIKNNSEYEKCFVPHSLADMVALPLITKASSFELLEAFQYDVSLFETANKSQAISLVSAAVRAYAGKAYDREENYNNVRFSDYDAPEIEKKTANAAFEAVCAAAVGMLTEIAGSLEAAIRSKAKE